MLRESDLNSSPEEATADQPAAADSTTEVFASGHDTAIADYEGLWPVLRNRNFVALWSGQVFSQLADKVYLVLMIAIIGSQFDAPDQSISGWVSAVMVAFTIPAVLFGSLAGVYVDRWSKQAVLVLDQSSAGRPGDGVARPPLAVFKTGAAFASCPLGLACCSS
jgi:MFS family permease